MQRFPHQYSASVAGTPTGSLTMSSPELPDLPVESPPEFGGPAGYWSPETLLVAAAADCFALTWRSVATANHVEWSDLRVEASGVLDRVERVTRFTEIRLAVHLTVPAGTDPDRIGALVDKTEGACLVSNSLSAPTTIDLHLAEG
ncbi:Uncharacterized OsmC-related protein [Raineyella antarctica]|uniref:Uncharacterized OsmC-related protein n=1 Tax=Raineyella antarctica TaxID=1577474 RepID=A0A1G6H3K3_9ACTN|nr:OsmC family protein [Raineyella antarctica]SDB88733.1 Uncharacterized OsmC-related protein [Raineyella antarctica]